MRECGTKGHGLVVGHSRSGWWLDFVILKAFSNLDDSMISQHHADTTQMITTTAAAALLATLWLTTQHLPHHFASAEFSASFCTCMETTVLHLSTCALMNLAASPFLQIKPLHSYSAIHYQNPSGKNNYMNFTSDDTKCLFHCSALPWEYICAKTSIKRHH